MVPSSGQKELMLMGLEMGWEEAGVVLAERAIFSLNGKSFV